MQLAIQIISELKDIGPGSEKELDELTMSSLIMMLTSMMKHSSLHPSRDIYQLRKEIESEYEHWIGRLRSPSIRNDGLVETESTIHRSTVALQGDARLGTMEIKEKRTHDS